MRILFVLLSLLAAGCASMPPPEAVKDLAPTGKLRAAINFGNPVLAQRGPSGEARGVSVDLAHELAKRLGVPLQMVFYDAAGKVTASLKEWDVAFVAIDPARAADIAFTAAYVHIEGTYLVRNDSPLKSLADFDRPNVRIAVGNRSAYDLYLTRTLKQAKLERVPTSAGAVDHFIEKKLEAAAGVKQPLVRYAAANPGYRVIDGNFMTIEQAMGTPRGREAGARYLRQFVEEMKASGFVLKGLQASGQTDAAVAPPAK
jgi:polar amino acid transport system substrate-binding protein